MNILIDIVHPADVLFFLNPIRILQSQGHSVCVASRTKDVTMTLLDAFEIEHRALSTAGRGVVSLAVELLKRDLALFKLAREFKPDVMCGFGGVAISHVGKIQGVPSLSFYDTERAPLQHMLTLPFISHMYVPKSYDGPIAKNRTTRFPGTKDFSYLHPDNFSPNQSIAMDLGLDPNRRNVFVRLVGWTANHDIGHKGWSMDTLRQLVADLNDSTALHISSELPLPNDLQSHEYRGPVHLVHHLLACCDTYIGESATMAGEAVLLGVPAIYATDDRRCYTDDLAAQGLVWKVLQTSPANLREAIDETCGLDRLIWQQRISSYLEGKPNLANYVVEQILKHAGADRHNTHCHSTD